jgi:predicted PurR-regulated permease PerM
MLLSVSVALFSGYPHWGWMIVFLLVYRVFQDYVLSPWLLSSGVELHPLLVLFGVLVGETVAGVPGLFLSVPVMASMRVVYRHLR